MTFRIETMIENHREKLDAYRLINKDQISLHYRAPVAQLTQHWIVLREVVSSTPAGPTLRVLK